MSPESHLCTYSNTKGCISMYIYQITNNITHDCYLGKTVIGIGQRFSSHKYNAKKNKSQAHLYRAMRKYGIENFTISINFLSVRNHNANGYTPSQVTLDSLLNKDSMNARQDNASQ